MNLASPDLPAWMRNAQRRLGCLVACFACCVSTAHAGVTVVDDFDASGALDAWEFSNGDEFPGATGTLALTASTEGNALRLGYDFSGGGVYVAATRNLPNAVTATAVRLKVQLPGSAQLTLRVRDSTGQWLQYEVSRPLVPSDEASWLVVSVELGPAGSYFDGAEDGLFHPPADALSFVVSRQSWGAQTGDVLFDELELLDTLEFEVSPTDSPFLEPFDGEQELQSGFGVVVHQLDDNTGLDAASAVGLSWARTDLFWSWVEQTPGVYDFSAFDAFVERLQTRNMRPLFILDYGNALYGGDPPVTKETIDAFARYAFAAAAHYAGTGARFEVWNEPDTALFWPPEGDPIAYARLAAEAANAVHLADPTAEVSTGGLSWFDFDFLQATLGAGAASGVDAIAIHPYRGEAEPETLGGHVAMARAMMRQELGNVLPIWDTEWGYTSTQFGDGHAATSRERQGVLAVRRFIASRLVGSPIAIWYDLRDDGVDPTQAEHNFGLLTADGAEKPAWHALRALHTAASGKQLTGVLNVAQPLLNGLRLRGETETTLVLWASLTAQPVRVVVSQPEAAADVWMNPLPVAQSYLLTEASGPLYLTYPRQTPESSVDAGEESSSSPTSEAEAGVPEPNQSGSPEAPAMMDVRPTTPFADGGTAPAKPPDASADAVAEGVSPSVDAASNDNPPSGETPSAQGCACTMSAPSSTRPYGFAISLVFALWVRRRNRTQQ